MGKFIDLTGQRFGRLVAVQTNGKNSNGQLKWLCHCDCGNVVTVERANLVRGHTQSCGCYREEIKKLEKKTHGQTGTRIFHIWVGIKQRCYNSNAHNFKNYGGRGITVCEEWRNSFEVFYEWAMSHGYSDDLSIDRIDVNGNYCPENCRWVTAIEQCNNRRSNHNITYNGETHTLTEWAIKTGINQRTLENRIRSGWTIEKALTTKGS